MCSSFMSIKDGCFPLCLKCFARHSGIQKLHLKRINPLGHNGTEEGSVRLLRAHQPPRKCPKNQGLCATEGLYGM
jgi:hypothetical protein